MTLTKEQINDETRHLRKSKTMYFKFCEGVAWIAANDNPGDNEDVETLSGYISVALLADLFEVPQEAIATLVWETRRCAPGLVRAGQ